MTSSIKLEYECIRDYPPPPPKHSSNVASEDTDNPFTSGVYIQHMLYIVLKGSVHLKNRDFLIM